MPALFREVAGLCCYGNRIRFEGFIQLWFILVHALEAVFSSSDSLGSNRMHYGNLPSWMGGAWLCVVLAVFPQNVIVDH